MSRFHYKDLGLDYIYLEDGYEIINTPYGEGYAITEAEALHELIAVTIVETIPQLRGQEVKFLRSVMNISQQCLAELLGLKDRGSIALYEKGRNEAIPMGTDRLFRYVFLDYTKKNRHLMGLIDSFRERENEAFVKLQELHFEKIENEWKAALAA